MRPLTLPGTLTDAAGTVAVAWQVSPLVGPGGERTYAVSGVVRGVECSGPGFEALGLVDCVITATLPGLVTSDAGTVPERLVMRMTITWYAECTVEVGGSSTGEGVAGSSAGRTSWLRRWPSWMRAGRGGTSGAARPVGSLGLLRVARESWAWRAIGTRRRHTSSVRRQSGPPCR